MYNADLLTGVVNATLGRAARLAPVLRISIANPMAARFRTGTTLAMFTLVVFTLVTGATTSGSFIKASLDEQVFGGGFNIRAATGGSAAITNMRQAIDTSPNLTAANYPVVASQSVLAVSAKQMGAPGGSADYLVRGADRSFLDHTTFGIGTFAKGYSSAASVWSALRDHPGLAVVDSMVVPRKDNFGFNPTPPDLQLTGLYLDQSGFTPISLAVRDPQTGRQVRLTVIGVLKESAPLEMVGITTSQQTVDHAFPGRAQPTIHYLRVASGVNPEQAASQLESAFLSHGLEAKSIHDVVRDASAASLLFNRLILAFMGLGLVVGVAALGVISARSVVERRQQIGVLRAIGYRRSTVQTAFLIESTLIALAAILIGTLLGLILAYNIISDQQQLPSWSNLTLVVPWLNLAVVFIAVLAVSLGATLLPARRAARVRPAEALRYE
jgi:putative ABC transport system permease protein